jgi:hypothetical protein
MLSAIDIESLENELCDLKMIASAMRQQCLDVNVSDLTVVFLMKSLKLVQVMGVAAALGELQNNEANLTMFGS